MNKSAKGTKVRTVESPITRITAILTPLLIFLILFHTIPSMSEYATKGVYTVKLKSKAGIVKIFLPDDISAGDTVSAAIALYPGGVTRETMAGNLKILSSYFIETSFFNVSASEKYIKLNVPRNSAGTRMKFTLRDASKKSIDSASVPIGLSSQVRVGDEKPTPYDYQCPLIGQAGRTVEIKGPFDGDFATTDFKIGNKKADVIAESPRKLVFESPTDVIGSVEVVLVESGVEVKRPFTCLQVMKIGEKDAVPVVSGSRTLPPSATSVRGEHRQSPGAPERELPPASRSLEFRGIKAEENIPVVERPPAIEAQPTVPVVNNEDIRLVLASQMDSTASLDGSIPSAPQAAVKRPAEPATDNAPTLMDEGTLGEESLKEAPIEPPRQEARPHETHAVFNGTSVKESSPADEFSGSASSVIEGQLLASFTGAAPDRTVSDAVQSDSAVESRTKAGTGYTVQVASYRDRRDADALAEKLKRKGYRAFVTEARLAGKGVWYRVRIGRFETRKEASAFGESLKHKERSLKSVYVAEYD